MQAAVPKQYLPLGKKTVLAHTLDCFLNHKSISKIFVAVSPDDGYWSETGLPELDNVVTVEGGQERCHSVFNALLHLLPEANDDDWVLIHDAARPCLRSEDIDMLIERLQDHDAGGLLAIPVRDTMKRSNTDDEVSETVERERLWHALTPQMFHVGPLFRAMKAALDTGEQVTDEASAIELQKKKPLLVEGHSDNIKITRPEDLQLAHFYLQQQGRI